MKVNEPVVVYTHQQTDYTHSTNDAFAIALRDNGNGCIDVVVFPVGGPVRFEQVCEFNEDVVTAGGTYWREIGSEPPDFSPLDHVNDAEWQQLNRRQQEELAKVKPEKREELVAQQRQQRQELRTALDARYQRKQTEGR
jgi:hypothetical protein